MSCIYVSLHHVKKIISISLVLMFLVSHLGLAVGTHYCMGMAVKSEIVLGHEHLDCGMGMDRTATHSEQEMIAASPCCQNTYASVDVENDINLQTALDQLNLEFVVAFIHSFWELDLALNLASLPTIPYKSPPKVLIPQEFLQVFRI